MIVLIFTVGCVFGTYWEEVLHLVSTLWTTGVFDWESRRGLVYGPFSPVYGIGAVLIYLVFYLPKFRGWVCLVGGSIFGGALEFLLSWLQEVIFQTRSWDYSQLWLNIDGRTTVPYALVWGILVFVTARGVCPFIEGTYRQIEAKRANRLCLAIALFLLFDITLSAAAVWRQNERDEGDPAETRLEKVLDAKFPDERMEEIYSQTVRVER